MIIKLDIHRLIIGSELIIAFYEIILALYRYQRCYRSVDRERCWALKIYSSIAFMLCVYSVAQFRWVFLSIQTVIPDVDNFLWYVFDFGLLHTIFLILWLRFPERDANLKNTLIRLLNNGDFFHDVLDRIPDDNIMILSDMIKKRIKDKSLR